MFHFRLVYFVNVFFFFSASKSIKKLFFEMVANVVGCFDGRVFKINTWLKSILNVTLVCIFLCNRICISKYVLQNTFSYGSCNKQNVVENKIRFIYIKIYRLEWNVS